MHCKSQRFQSANRFTTPKGDKILCANAVRIKTPCKVDHEEGQWYIKRASMSCSFLVNLSNFHQSKDVLVPFLGYHTGIKGGLGTVAGV
jgi:hypothetical protein